MCDPRDLDFIWNGTMEQLMESLATLSSDLNMRMPALNLIRVDVPVGENGLFVQIDLVVAKTDGKLMHIDVGEEKKHVADVKRLYNTELSKLLKRHQDAMIPIPPPKIQEMFKHIAHTVFDVLTDEVPSIEHNNRQRTIKACEPKARAVYEFLKFSFARFRVPSWVWTFVTYLGVPLKSSVRSADTAACTWNHVHFFLLDIFSSEETPSVSSVRYKESEWSKKIFTDLNRKLNFLYINFLRHVPGFSSDMTQSARTFTDALLSATQKRNIEMHSEELRANLKFIFGDIDAPVPDEMRFNPMMSQHNYILFAIGVRNVFFGRTPDLHYHIKNITGGDPASLGQLCASVMRCVLFKDTLMSQSMRARYASAMKFLAKEIPMAQKLKQNLHQSMIAVLRMDETGDCEFTLPVIHFECEVLGPWKWAPRTVRLADGEEDVQVFPISVFDRTAMEESESLFAKP